MRRRLAALTIMVLPVAACGSSSTGTATPVPSSTGAPSSTASTSAAATSAAGTSAAPRELVSLPVNAVVVDPELGNMYAVDHVIRNYPIPKSLTIYSDFKHVEIVLLQVNLTSGKARPASTRGLSVVTDDGTQGESAPLVEPTMAAAGYPPAPYLGPKIGKSTRGWVAIRVTNVPPSKTLRLRYHREATSVLNDDNNNPVSKYPARTVDVPLIG